MDSILVVGGGPAGLTCATECQKKGYNTVLIEEHPEIGKPINCTGIISVEGTREAGLDVSKITLNAIRGARLFSPSNEEMLVKRDHPVAYIVERDKLDQLLVQKALAEGVDIRLETSLLDIRNQTVFVQKKGRGEIVKAKIVVGADGPYSKTRSLMGVQVPKEKFVLAYQFRVKGNFEKDFVQVHMGSFAKNYFAWVAPENEEMARVGLAVSEGSVRKSFEEFEKKLGFTGEKCDMCSALIPCAEPFKEIVKGNTLLVGDAAFQTKATTGGGILSGINAAKVCAKTIDLHLREKKPLTDYWHHLKEINKELYLHAKIRKYMNSLTDEKTNEFFIKMKKAGMQEFLEKYGDMDKPSRFVGKIATNPRMVLMLPEVVKFFMT